MSETHADHLWDNVYADDCQRCRDEAHERALAEDVRRGSVRRSCDSCGADGFRTTFSPDHSAHFCDGCYARETGT